MISILKKLNRKTYKCLVGQHAALPAAEAKDSVIPIGRAALRGIARLWARRQEAGLRTGKPN
jgi:hypothetical protein